MNHKRQNNPKFIPINNYYKTKNLIYNQKYGSSGKTPNSPHEYEQLTQYGLPKIQRNMYNRTEHEERNREKGSKKSSIHAYKTYAEDQRMNHHYGQFPTILNDKMNQTPDLKHTHMINMNPTVKQNIRSAKRSPKEIKLKSQITRPKLRQMRKSDIAMINNDLNEESVKQQIIYKILKDQLSRMKNHNYTYEEKQNQKIARLLNLDEPIQSNFNQQTKQFQTTKPTHSSKISKFSHQIGFPYSSDVPQTQASSSFPKEFSPKIPSHLRPINYEERKKEYQKTFREKRSSSVDVQEIRPPGTSEYYQKKREALRQILGIQQQQQQQQHQIPKSPTDTNRTMFKNNSYANQQYPFGKKTSPPRDLSQKEKFIVDRLAYPRKTNRYCPCCAKNEGEEGHHMRSQKTIKINPLQNNVRNSKKTNVSISPDTKSQGSFLMKGADRLAYKRVPTLSKKYSDKTSIQNQHQSPLSKNENQSIASSRKVSREVTDRLMSNYDKKRKLCATIHNGTPSPRTIRSEERLLESQRHFQTPTMELRACSEEKPHFQDVSLSPMNFSEFDKKEEHQSQKQEGNDIQDDFTKRVEVMENFQQTEQELLENYRWKKQTSEAEQTEPVVIEVPKLKVTIEIQTEQEEQPPEPVVIIPQKDDMAQYDWAESQIFKYVLQKYKESISKIGYKTQPQQKGNQLSSNPSQTSLGLTQNHSVNKNEHDYNPQQDQIEDEKHLNPMNEQIYTEIEATYKASLLKKKARTYNTPETLLEFHIISKKTVEILSKNMIMGDISHERIFEICKDISRENVIKLLLRCKKMYEARVDIKKILQLIIRKEEMFEDKGGILEVLSFNEKRKNLNNQDEEKLHEGLQMISRVLRTINHFRHEHKIFKGQFIFKKQEYVEILLSEAKELIEFMESKGIDTPILKENGLLIPKDDEYAKTTVGNYEQRQDSFSPKKSILMNKSKLLEKLDEFDQPLQNFLTQNPNQSVESSFNENTKNHKKGQGDTREEEQKNTLQNKNTKFSLDLKKLTINPETAEQCQNSSFPTPIRQQSSPYAKNLIDPNQLSHLLMISDPNNATNNGRDIGTPRTELASNKTGQAFQEEKGAKRFVNPIISTRVKEANQLLEKPFKQDIQSQEINNLQKQNENIDEEIDINREN